MKKGKAEIDTLIDPPSSGFRKLTSIAQNELEGRLTGPLALAVAAATLGSSFLFGYNIGVMNNPDKIIKSWIANVSFPAMHGYQLSEGGLTTVWAWTVSVFPLGGMFGGLACGWMADRFGRKGAMMLSNILALAAALVMGIAKPTSCYILLIIGRLIIGITVGLGSGLAPMYLIEVSPINLRGRLGSVNQLVVTISILLANVLGLPSLLGTQTLWPILLAFIAIPAIWQIVSLRFCPESPKYLLLVKKKEADAANALKRLRGKEEVSAEFCLMQDEAEQISNRRSLTFMQMLRTPLFAWSLTIAVVMMLAQQWSGINVAMFYSTNIFRGAGLTEAAATGATLGVGALNVIMTLVSTMIVDRAGRRLLMLTGLGGMWTCGMCISITLILLKVDRVAYFASSYFAVAFVCLFVASFAVGPGSIPWFYVSEIFDQESRGMANAVAVGTNWGTNFIVACTFPPWEKTVEEYSFLLYAAMTAIFWIFILIWAPETKNRQLRDIQRELDEEARKFCRCGGHSRK